MSEITDRIQHYRDTGQGWDELFRWLTTLTFPDPKRYQNAPNPVREEDWYGDDDGTWDEVKRARNYGQLTQDEYMQIVHERERLAKQSGAP